MRKVAQSHCAATPADINTTPTFDFVFFRSRVDLQDLPQQIFFFISGCFSCHPTYSLIGLILLLVKLSFIMHKMAFHVLVCH